jgi:hypothetical protein
LNVHKKRVDEAAAYATICVSEATGAMSETSPIESVAQAADPAVLVRMVMQQAATITDLERALATLRRENVTGHFKTSHSWAVQNQPLVWLIVSISWRICPPSVCLWRGL